MSTRQSYTIALEITPTAPLTHGAGNEGNEQLLCTREVVVQMDGEWERLDVPCVSGAALKATLREWAVRDALERAGVGEGSVSKDALRLLLKGGKNDKGGATVSLAEARRLRDLFPLLAVFGSMDGGLPIAGLISCSDVMPWCVELLSGGLLPERITPLQVSVDGEPLAQGETIEVWPDTRPIPAALTRTVVQYYRHDMLGGPMAKMLQGAAVEQIEDARSANKCKAPAKDKRREANESMPYSHQAIAPGTPMVAVIRLQNASEVEFAALGVALARWIRSGGNLGGGATKGHGACRVKVAGAIRYSPPTGEQAADPGTALDVLGDDDGPVRLATLYDAHVRERAETIRDYVSQSTR